MSHKYMTKVINKSVICSIAHLFLLQIMLFTKLMLGLELLTHSQFTTENTVIPLRSKLNVTKDRKNKQRNKNKTKTQIDCIMELCILEWMLQGRRPHYTPNI